MRKLNSSNELYSTDYLSYLNDITSELYTEINQIEHDMSQISNAASKLLSKVDSILVSDIYPPDKYNIDNPDSYTWFEDPSIVPDDDIDAYYDAWEAFSNASDQYTSLIDEFKQIKYYLYQITKNSNNN